MVNELVFQPSDDLPWLQSILKAGALLISLLFMLGVIHAQSLAKPDPSDTPYVVEGVSDTIAYGLGRSLRINGTVRNGAISLGGDVIVQGTVEGDVAAIAAP